jgi:glycosyltransferase involved in cell wall biosynthesis
MPKVSVVIPVYNGARYIKEAIESVLNQTYKDYEIIIVDDGSTDNTKQVLDEYLLSKGFNIDNKENQCFYSLTANPYTLIRYMYQENKGPGAARNRGIKEAKGEYIAFLDSDDLWLPEKLKKSINFIETYNFDWICTASHRILGNDGQRKENLRRRISDVFLDSSKKKINLFKNGLFFFSSVPIYTGALLLKRRCFVVAGLFCEYYKVGEDWDMWLRFEEHNLRGGYLDELLFIHRLNKNSIMRSKRYPGLKEHVRLAQKHAKILGMENLLIRRSYSEFLWRCSDLFLASGKYRDSFICFIKSWYLWPSKEKLVKSLRFIKRRVK